MQKWKFLNMGPKTTGIFWLQFEKDIVIFQINTRIFLKVKFPVKMKFFLYRTENALFGCLGQQFWKSTVIFEINALDFDLLQSLIKKLKSLNLGPKMSDLNISGLEFENYIWNQRPRIRLNAKFQAKTKIPKFGTKNVLFGIFGIFEISNL